MARYGEFSGVLSGMQLKGFIRTRGEPPNSSVACKVPQIKEDVMIWRQSDWLIVRCGGESRLPGETQSRN
jgi:hypothetical protein